MKKTAFVLAVLFSVMTCEAALRLGQLGVNTPVGNAGESAAVAGLLTAKATTNLVSAALAVALDDETATSLLSIDGLTKITLLNGTGTLEHVTYSSNVYVVATSGAGYNGPAVGTVWIGPISENTWATTNGWGLTYELESTPFYFFQGTGGRNFQSSVMPGTGFPYGGDAVGSFLVDWISITNVYEVATAAPTLLIIRGEVSAHNTTNDAHSARFAAKANVETVVYGQVGTAAYGNTYNWISATNVLLRLGSITAGQKVNYASLANTSTNTITAIGVVGWRWTGGNMTNSIAAGRMMTFGWEIDAATGKTNAYATAASAN